MNLVNGSAAFQLHRRNYDVWLANLRGVTPYGRQHLELTDVMTQFWRYSFHEHGAYDLPAIIDHIVEQKQREKQQRQGEEREQAKEEQAKEEQDRDQDREQAKEELEHSAEQAANVEPEQTEERVQPEQEAAGPTQEELHQVLLIGHSQVRGGWGRDLSQIDDDVSSPPLYRRPLTPSWCSAPCIRDSINTSC